MRRGRPAFGRRWLGAACLAALAGCQREARDFRLDPPVAAALAQAASMPNGNAGAPPDVMVALDRPYAKNAWNLSEGKRLWGDFNCSGCHADGGGATGPALLDGWWAYGPDLVSTFVSIRDGRPNGMPAYAEWLTTEQIWQLAGYVQRIGSYSNSAAAPSRNDAMQSRPGENRTPAAAPPERQPSRR